MVDVFAGIVGAGLLVYPAWVIAQRVFAERWTLALVAGATIAWAEVVLLAELLSVFDAFGRPGILISELVTATVVTVWLRPRFAGLGRSFSWQRATAALKQVPPAQAVLLAVLGVAFAINAILAYAIAPNNADSMVYHLSRAAYWVQYESVFQFHGAGARQASMPPNGEILLAWAMALTKQDSFTQFVQLAFYCLSACCVYEGARLLRFPHRGSLLAALIFAALPQPLLQASTTQNDLVAAFAVGASLVLGVTALRTGRLSQTVVAALAIGLTVGTKATGLVAMPVVGALLLAAAIKHARKVDIARFAGLAVVAVALLGSWNYVENYQHYGNPFAPRSFSERGAVTEGGAVRPKRGEEGENLVRMAWSSLAETTPVEWTALADGLQDFGKRIIPAAVTYGNTLPPQHLRFNFEVSSSIDEDTSGYGLLGLFLLVPVLLLALFRGSRPARIATVGGIAGVALLSLGLRYSVYNGRVILPFVALVAPLLAYLARRTWLETGAAALAAAVVLPVVLLNPSKPVLRWEGRTVIGMSRSDEIALRNPRFIANYRDIKRLLPKTAPIGVRVRESSYDYPLFGPRLERRVYRVLPGKDDERRGIVDGHRVAAIYYAGISPPRDAPEPRRLAGGDLLVLFGSARSRDRFARAIESQG